MEFEFGLLTAAQFGGTVYRKNEDGSLTFVKDKPNGLKDFMKVLIPKQASSCRMYREIIAEAGTLPCRII